MKIKYECNDDLCYTLCPVGIIIGQEYVMVASKYCAEHCGFCKKVPKEDAIECSHPSLTNIKEKENDQRRIL
jgi:Fe-S-cluster-containing hydrogenase component 2